MKKIRLNDFEISAILETFESIFAPEDHIWLFGSRVDETRKGGDIDLLIESASSYPSRGASNWGSIEMKSQDQLKIEIKLAHVVSSLFLVMRADAHCCPRKNYKNFVIPGFRNLMRVFTSIEVPYYPGPRNSLTQTLPRSRILRKAKLSQAFLNSGMTTVGSRKNA
ncbi:MAG: nucleotidyltransferase domain-containing protein [Proteobacteria bacterium]|nr:nucleotidyltransferase domain-containing protein [Pseudomonadota bacterium]